MKSEFAMGSKAFVCSSGFQGVVFLVLELSVAVLVLDGILCNELGSLDPPGEHRHDPHQN